MHYFPKDDVGNIYGKKLPFSRSSSKQSFQDEFDDSEFPCPFLVDDITDPCNRYSLLMFIDLYQSLHTNTL